MARADSTVRVNILGDAKSLQRAAGQSETAVSGLNKKIVAVGGVIAGAFAADAVLDFAQTALHEADRVGDAAGILEAQLGDLAQPLIDAADEFDRLGASEGDMLDLETAIVNVGTALGITKQELADNATEAAATAAALALITDTDADTWIDQIGKAATGSERALRALGVSVTDAEVEARALANTGKDTAEALTDGELAAARLELILEKLAPRIAEVTTGTADLEQRQAQLQARMETLTGKVGEHLEGPLNDLLGWVLAGIDGWEMLGANLDAAGASFENVTDFIRAMLGPIGLAADGVQGLIDVLETAIGLWNSAPWNSGGPRGSIPGNGGPSSGGSRSQSGVTVQVNGGSPEVVEQAVRDAIRRASGRGPLE